MFRSVYRSTIITFWFNRTLHNSIYNRKLPAFSTYFTSQLLFFFIEFSLAIFKAIKHLHFICFHEWVIQTIVSLFILIFDFYCIWSLLCPCIVDRFFQRLDLIFKVVYIVAITFTIALDQTKRSKTWCWNCWSWSRWLWWLLVVSKFILLH